jgi:hypothetical protein
MVTAKQAADVCLACFGGAQSAQSYITVPRRMHFQVCFHGYIVGVDLEAKPVPAILHRPNAPATCVYDLFNATVLPPTRGLVEFTAEVAKLFGEERVHFESGQTERRRLQVSQRRALAGGKESRGPARNSACVQEQVLQPQAFEHVLAPARDELAADAMAWIVSGLENQDRHSLLP